MTFLVDNQLPPALARWFDDAGHNGVHVAAVALDRADDRELWRYASEHGMAIVSKDDDFVHLSLTDSSGPALVWVRLGNCRRPVLLAAFERALPDIVEALRFGQRIVELR